MSDLDSRLRDRLHQRGATTDVGRGSLSAVMARGGQRRRRARIATSAVLAVGVIGGVLGSVAWLDRRGGGDGSDLAISVGPADDAGGSASDTAAAVEMDALDLRPVDAVDRLANVRSVATANGTVYALSTAPGATDTNEADRYVPAPQALYRARDGGGWDAVPLGDDLRLHSLAASVNRLYGVGTAPAAAAVGGGAADSGEAERSEGVVAWSDDGGVTWSTAQLPVRPEGLDPSVRTWVGDSTVAVGDAGVVVVLQTWADIDLTGRLPDGTNLDFGYVVTADGVAVFGPPDEVTEEMRLELENLLCEPDWAFDAEGLACVAPDGGESVGFDPVEVFSAVGVGGGEPVARYTWADLGVSAEVGRLVRGEPTVFHSADGENFQAIEGALAQDGDTSYGHRAIATDDGFLVAAEVFGPSTDISYEGGGTSSTALWRSSDGVVWEPVTSPGVPQFDWIEATGRVGDRLALAGTSASGPIVASTADGTAWATTDLADLAPLGEAGRVELHSAAVGDGGVALLLREYLDPVAAAGGVDIAAGDHTLRILDSQGRAVLLDSSGAEVASLESVWEHTGSVEASPTALAASTTAPPDADPPSTTVVSEAAVPPDTHPARPYRTGEDDIMIDDPVTGEELTRVSSADVWTAIEEANAADGIAAGRAWLAWSPDGTSWSLTDLSDQLSLADGTEAGLRGVYVGGSVVTVELGEAVPGLIDAGETAPGRSRTLVATIPG